MKTSNKLLISILAITFLAILGSSMVLKSEFDKIDRDNPFYGYSQQVLEPFRAIKVNGNYPHLLQLQQGDSYELLSRQDAQLKLDWEIKDDTLYLNLQYPETKKRYNQSYAFYDQYPGLNIITPQLSALMVDGISCRLVDWNESQMQVDVQGSENGILLKGSHIAQLTSSISQGAIVLLEKSNTVEIAEIHVQDSSSFITEQANIDSLNLQLDSNAQVKLPGYLLNRLLP